MKKKILYFFAIVTAMSMASCSDENGLDDLAARGDALRVSVDETETRTAYEQGTNVIKVTWVTDDAIRVCAEADPTNPDVNRRDAYELKFVLTAGAGTGFGTFTKEESAEQTSKYFNSRVPNTIYYPYDAPKGSTAATFLNGRTQTQKRNGNDPAFTLQNDLELNKLDFMTDVTTAGSVEVKFEHQISVLKITMPVIPQSRKAHPTKVTVTGSKYGTDKYVLNFDQAYQFDCQSDPYTVVAYVVVPPATFTGVAGDNDSNDWLNVQLALDDNAVYNFKHTFHGTKAYAAGGVYNCVFTNGSDGGGGEIEGETYIEFALPSGAVWAERNIGATTEADMGLYFMWGETYGHSYDPKTGTEYPLPGFSADSCTLYNVSNEDLLDPNGPFRFDALTYNLNGVGGTTASTQTRPDFQNIVRDVDIYYTYETVATVNAKNWATYYREDPVGSKKFVMATSQNEVQNNPTYIWYTRGARQFKADTEVETPAHYDYTAVAAKAFDKKNWNSYWYKNTSNDWVQPTSQDDCNTLYNGGTTMYTRALVPYYHKVSVLVETRRLGDAATANWGSAWHMPNVVQMAELLNYTTGYGTKVTRKDSQGRNVDGYVLKADIAKLKAFYQQQGVDLNKFDWDKVAANEMFWPMNYTWEGSWETQADFRYSCTTAAYKGDESAKGTYDPTVGYNWELHKTNMHSHHDRATALSMRPVATIR